MHLGEYCVTQALCVRRFFLSFQSCGLQALRGDKFVTPSGWLGIRANISSQTITFSLALRPRKNMILLEEISTRIPNQPEGVTYNIYFGS